MALCLESTTAATVQNSDLADTTSSATDQVKLERSIMHEKMKNSALLLSLLLLIHTATLPVLLIGVYQRNRLGIYTEAKLTRRHVEV
jgi:hypothetical protein